MDQRKKQGEGREYEGTSPAGAEIYRYADTPATSGAGASKPQLENMKLREQAYEELFGTVTAVSHDMGPLTPRINVYHFEPQIENRDWHTYITSGMSDLAMPAPPEAGLEFQRAELVFYSSENDTLYQDLLRHLARFPHDKKTWIHWQHTLPNGHPPEPLFDGSALDTTLFMPSVVEPDALLGQMVSIEGAPVNLLWCVPITSPECAMVLERGMPALYQVFDQAQHPHIFSGDRQSYV